MGDAGPPTPPPLLTEQSASINSLDTQDVRRLREIKVLVTGFGPFKSFLINPSWLIASTLSEELYPRSITPKYKISLIIHPSPIRVAYNTVSTLVPTLIMQHNPDFILHIGMAGGRDCYSLETCGHRDGYRIKDVDESDGFNCGESVWKSQGVPDILFVGWDEEDVLRRWETGVDAGLKERGFLGRVGHTSNTATISVPGRGVGVSGGVGPNVSLSLMWGTSNVGTSSMRAEDNKKKGVVKLSRDAGRFLCEYALFESLSRRWLDAQRCRRPPSESGSLPDHQQQQQPGLLSPTTSSSSPAPHSRSGSPTLIDPDLAAERVGKVAFLHVPGWTCVEDINRGVVIAEEAIRALVGSWQDGRRRTNSGRGTASAGAFTTQHSEA
ncbi:uncharacterized protein Z518_04479 [Rhinocladiella mackenziei CBS 650.93]|uniref:Pyroglutamyl-peptidase I n=1 Tax=Rhinocladiella mackenziei CBS 650.93 TaxID=1442369 RepID=A0A0D2H7Y6_9EURO|nr:uncharacterized protein Z518_04479 [Rhinocladiella mackenziei CBS 650.93]KIX06503.1 hypothetical protein Z518_04479 [Rhinocladiella mackenziei CBS 650.93]